MKISKRAREMFAYFSKCEDSKRLTPLQVSAEGASALEAFTQYESHGTLPPTREPELLARALNGKSWHGVTVSNIAIDLLDCITNITELSTYPSFMQREVCTLASKMALEHPGWGFVPSFIQHKLQQMKTQ